jgi:pimeloyl-ACP methyl ester carboxylesterase
VRTFLVTTAVAAAVLILIGTTYQGVATALERRRYPHPGQMVDVGGHQLHIQCAGQGAPTVVLEAPAGSPSPVWGWVQPQIAGETRVCSYDRAGLGWSEAGDRPYDPGRVPEELRRLLSTAQLDGPYVLVGHSLGAMFVRRFAELYPADTAALVLIDAGRARVPDPGLGTLSPWLARTGILRATGLLADNWKGLPPASAGAVSAFLHRPDHLTRAAREAARLGDAIRIGEAARLPSRLRVVSVSGDLHDRNAGQAIARAVLQVAKPKAPAPRP